jgi:hypothetical protein
MVFLHFIDFISWIRDHYTVLHFDGGRASPRNFLAMTPPNYQTREDKPYILFPLLMY